MTQKIASLGGFMAVAALISGALSFVGYNLRILMWVDMWGPTTGWVIRGAVLVVGAILFFVFGKMARSST